MTKNIVILLDGTSNSISANRTNVLRLYGTLEKSERQLVYYDPGVGTFGDDNAWSRVRRKVVEIWGLATGWGLDQNVKEAYRFLVENYVKDNQDGNGTPGRDRIYIFGFSRGAYTARVLAGFIHAIGLIEQRNLNLLDYAYRAYKAVDQDADAADDSDESDGGKYARDKKNKFLEVRLYERTLAPDRPPIRLLGLFDTVASMIESGRHGPRLREHAFTGKNVSVQSVRHAVSIHEHRTMFRPQLWPEGQEYWGNPFNRKAAQAQDAREVWFSGTHCDIGGGFPEQDSGLAKLTLEWMIEQVAPTGLHFNTLTTNKVVLGKYPEKGYVAPDAKSKLHNSMNWAWAILEFLPRRKPKASRRWSLFGLTIPLFEQRNIPNGARIHQSVLDRFGDKLPPNLPANRQTEPWNHCTSLP